MIHLIFTIEIDTTPTIETFLCTDTNQATSTHGILFSMQPRGKTHLELIVPHLYIIKRKVFLRHGILRHRTYPQFLFAVLPRTPERLIHGCTGCYPERYTDTIYFQNILIVLQHTGNVINCHFILYLIIHMENPEFYFQVILTDIINT